MLTIDILESVLANNCDKLDNLETVNKLLDDNLIKTISNYTKYNSDLLTKFGNKSEFKKLVTIRLIADDIFRRINNLYCKEDASKIGHRINAIGKIMFRVLLCMDENICLIEKGYGFTVISNIRLILECLAVSEYLWDSGEEQTNIFQDYAQVQIDKNFDINPQGWIEDKNLKTLGNLVNRMGDKNLHKLYRICSNYIHASPFSMDSAITQNHRLQNDENSYFPLGYHDTIYHCCYLLGRFIENVVNWFIKDDSDKFKYLTMNKLLLEWVS